MVKSMKFGSPTICSHLSQFVTIHCNQCLKCFLPPLVTESWLIATKCNRFVIISSFFAMVSLKVWCNTKKRNTLNKMSCNSDINCAWKQQSCNLLPPQWWVLLVQLLIKMALMGSCVIVTLWAIVCGVYIYIHNCTRILYIYTQLYTNTYIHNCAF